MVEQQHKFHVPMGPRKYHTATYAVREERLAPRLHELEDARRDLEAVAAALVRVGLSVQWGQALAVGFVYA